MSTVDKKMVVERIQRRLAELNVSANAASVMAGRNREWWGQVVRKQELWPTTDNLVALCGALGLRANYVLFGKGARLLDEPDISEDLTMVPLVSWVAASSFAEITVPAEEVEKFIPVAGLEPGDYIALEVRGDSMDRIAPDGSIAVINRRKRDMIDNKFYVVASEDGGSTTLKRFKEDWPARLEPYSHNPEHQTIFIREPVKVVGQLARVITEL